jgi:phage-related minor tail protein
MADTTQTISLNADLSPLNASLAAAAQTLQAFADGPVTDAGATIERAVTRSFNSVASTIARAATSGKLSIDRMVAAILADLDRIAIKEFIVKPIEGLVSSIVGSILPVSGARAAGGPVAAGAAYLVGEQGPELFVPSANGVIQPHANAGAARPQIVMNVTARDAQSFLKSESQIAAMMTRALARGQRNM